MAKKFNREYLYMLTANDLLSGDVVFWDGKAWSLSVSDARVVADEKCVAELEATGKKEEEANRVVEAYLVPMQAGEAGFRLPVELRERQRLKGPGVDFLTNNRTEDVAG